MQNMCLFEWMPSVAETVAGHAQCLSQLVATLNFEAHPKFCNTSIFNHQEQYVP